MAETYKKLPDGTLQITKSQDTVLTTVTEEEIVGKIAETQTKIDHLNIDLAATQKEKVLWEEKLALLKS